MEIDELDLRGVRNEIYIILKYQRGKVVIKNVFISFYAFNEVNFRTKSTNYFLTFKYSVQLF